MLYDSTATAMKAGDRLVGTIALKVTATCRFTKQWFTATGDGTQPEPLVAGDLVADPAATPAVSWSSGPRPGSSYGGIRRLRRPSRL